MPDYFGYTAEALPVLVSIPANIITAERRSTSTGGVPGGRH